MRPDGPEGSALPARGAGLGRLSGARRGLEPGGPSGCARCGVGGGHGAGGLRGVAGTEGEHGAGGRRGRALRRRRDPAGRRCADLT